MSLQQTNSSKHSAARLFLPVRVLAVVATYVSATVFQLVLLDIASSLNTTAGTASQIPAISRLVGVAVGLVISFLSIKFNHKSLLIFGLGLSAVGAVGNSFAPNVFSMIISDSFRGAGFVIIGAMVLALIGEVLSSEKRGSAVGWIQSSSFIAYMIASPATTLITNTVGWRAVMSGFVFPLALVSIILVFLTVPSQKSSSPLISKTTYIKAYKQVLSNRCILGCFVAYAGNYAAAAFLTYYVSFYRIHFNMPLSYGGIIVIIGAIVGTSSALVSGKLIGYAGRKRLGVIAGMANGALIISFLFMPTLISSVILRLAAAFFGSMALVSFAALVIEQVSEHKGTLTSIYSTLGGIGTVIGLAAGGFVLNLFNNYQLLMVILGSLGIVSAVVFLLLATDKPKSKTAELKF